MAWSGALKHRIHQTQNLTHVQVVCSNNGTGLSKILSNSGLYIASIALVNWFYHTKMVEKLASRLFI